ncbi:hypothetical protein EV424DRAFT_389781 [Suillus variegatus]|nr:hypothetical protein EV424DRAFT_389781 [Suillus variegatus]
MADSPHTITSLEALAIILLADAETPDVRLFAATIAFTTRAVARFSGPGSWQAYMETLNVEHLNKQVVSLCLARKLINSNLESVNASNGNQIIYMSDMSLLPVNALSTHVSRRKV